MGCTPETSIIQDLQNMCQPRNTEEGLGGLPSAPTFSVEHRCTAWTLMDWGFPWNVPWCSFRAIRQLIWPHFSGAHGSPTSQRFLRPFQLANAGFISSGAVGITEKDWLGREPCFQHCPGIWGDTAHSLKTRLRSTLCAGRTELGDTAFPFPSPGAWHAAGNSTA